MKHIVMKNITKFKHGQRGIAIEYVMIMLVLATLLIGAIFTAAVLSLKQAENYRDYFERKDLIDSLGRCFVENYTLNLDRDLQSTFGDNEYGITWQEENNDTLVVRCGETVQLIVKMEFQNESWKVVVYRYGTL